MIVNNEPITICITSQITSVEVINGTVVTVSGAMGPQGATGATGPQGDTGATGQQGPQGLGVPEGGTEGQILAKIDGDDYNTEWIEPTGGLSGEAYAFVAADSADPLVNGAALVAAYEAAKLLTPYGSALSATNRYTILMGDGIYDTGVELVIGQQYIDFQSLSGKQVTFLQSIGISANDVKVCDINCGENKIQINYDFPSLYIKNCTGGYSSFGGNGGTFSGTAESCIGGEYSFGGNGGTFSGTAENCIGGAGSFGGGGTFSGTAKNCTGGEYSFGGILQGKLFYCILTSGIFTTVSHGGRTYYCIDGNGNTNNQ